MAELKRITIQLDPVLFDDLNRVIKHGFRRHVLASLIKMAVKAIEADGEMMIGALMSGQFQVVRDEQERSDIGTI